MKWRNSSIIIFSDDGASPAAPHRGRRIRGARDDATQRRPAKAFDRDGLVLVRGSFSRHSRPDYESDGLEAGRFRDRVEAFKGVTSLMTAALPQLAVAELLESGFFDRHINRLRIRVADQNAKDAFWASGEGSLRLAFDRPPGLLSFGFVKKAGGEPAVLPLAGGRKRRLFWGGCSRPAPKTARWFLLGFVLPGPRSAEVARVGRGGAPGGGRALPPMQRRRRGESAKKTSSRVLKK